VLHDGVASGDERGERRTKPFVGADALVVESHAAGELFELGLMLAEGGQVRISQRSRVDSKGGLAFEALEGSRVGEIELLFISIDGLEDEHVVTGMLEPRETFAELLRIDEAIGDDRDDAPVGDLAEHLIDGSGQLGHAASVARLGGMHAQGADDLTPRALAARSPHHGSDFIGVDGQSDAIALLERDVGDRGGHGGGVVELAPVGSTVETGLVSLAAGAFEGARAVAHRSGCINQDDKIEVRLLLMLLQLELVGSSEDLPIEVAEVITGHVGTMLGKLDGQALVRRAMGAGGEPFDDHLRPQLETGETCQGLGVEIDGRIRLWRARGGAFNLNGVWHGLILVGPSRGTSCESNRHSRVSPGLSNLRREPPMTEEVG
jgi:hypothetical protein